MDICEMSDWTVESVSLVVRVGADDEGFARRNGKYIKTFPARRFHGLVLTLSGKTIYTINGSKAVFTDKGNLTYLPQGLPYTAEITEPGECICINFSLKEESSLDTFSHNLRNFPLWQKAFTDMLHAWNFQRQGYRARLLSLLYECFANLVEEMTAGYLPSSQKKRVQSVMEKLEVSGTYPDIKQIAEMCAMSETYFRKIFRAIYGTSPKQYLICLRFRMAEGMLAATNASVNDVAAACGFDNVYAFSRAFKNYEKMSPSQYRDNIQQKPEKGK